MLFFQKALAYVADRILDLFDTYGKARWQPLFERLHRISLRGMNVGTGGNVDHSGEDSVFRAVRDLSGSLDGCVIFDAGANVGIYTKAAVEHFPLAQVHSFEPSGVAFNLLSAGLSNIPNVILNNFGFSDRCGEVTLYSDRPGSVLGSIYRRNLEFMNVSMDAEETVLMNTVDEYCRDAEIERIALLKMDTEGNELKILDGAKEMLGAGRIDAIQFEFGGANIDSRTYLRDYFSLLGDRYRFYRVMRDGVHPLGRYQERHEMFTTTNYLAVRREPGNEERMEK